MAGDPWGNKNAMHWVDASRQWESNSALLMLLGCPNSVFRIQPHRAAGKFFAASTSPRCNRGSPPSSPYTSCNFRSTSLSSESPKLQPAGRLHTSRSRSSCSRSMTPSSGLLPHLHRRSPAELRNWQSLAHAEHRLVDGIERQGIKPYDGVNTQSKHDLRCSHFTILSVSAKIPAGSASSAPYRGSNNLHKYNWRLRLYNTGGGVYCEIRGRYGQVPTLGYWARSPSPHLLQVLGKNDPLPDGFDIMGLKGAGGRVDRLPFKIDPL